MHESACLTSLPALDVILGKAQSAVRNLEPDAAGHSESMILVISRESLDHTCQVSTASLVIAWPLTTLVISPWHDVIQD